MQLSRAVLTSRVPLRLLTSPRSSPAPPRLRREPPSRSKTSAGSDSRCPCGFYTRPAVSKVFPFEGGSSHLNKVRFLGLPTLNFVDFYSAHASSQRLHHVYFIVYTSSSSPFSLNQRSRQLRPLLSGARGGSRVLESSLAGTCTTSSVLASAGLNFIEHQALRRRCNYSDMIGFYKLPRRLCHRTDRPEVSLQKSRRRQTLRKRLLRLPRK
ncbi:hypothetical protein DFH09DRAFT_511659 [Mycena vulgaris]|nr:hypothetical protein DFH09DRAFT_511659 [Mycena vulgaris]